MSTVLKRKVVLVTRRTRLEQLVGQHHTLAQAKFYLEHLGADFSDYQREDAAYARSLQACLAALQAWGRFQRVDRSYLPNFVFAGDDIVVALGQDGVVANTMKYLHGQPLIGLNPEPTRWDGILAPFAAPELATILGEVAADARPTQAVTMAEARLTDGQKLLAVNDLFIGPRSHTSALYEIEHAGRREAQSSSGIIVATGLGSTAWLKSVVAGSLAVAGALRADDEAAFLHPPLAWDAERLTFVVREPFASRSSGTSIVYGAVTAGEPLRVRSRMAEQGVIFSDGMEADFLRFPAGIEATIGMATNVGRLVV